MLGIFGGDPHNFGKVPDPPDWYWGCGRDEFDESKCIGCSEYDNCYEEWIGEDELPAE